MNDTQQLLAAYVSGGSEAAFQEIVRRYVNLVHSTALRLAGGDSHLAQDISQTVFIQLARKAHKLSPDVTLGGWLHRVTCNTAVKMLRSERRRLNRETEAMLMNAQSKDGDAGFAQIAPLLDEAINQLAEADRSAIVLRFFEQCDFRAVGLALGSNEDAARMRVNRALEKLQGLLRQRGVTLSTTALGTALAAGAVSAAPAGLAAAVAGGAITAGTAAAGGTTIGVLHLMSQFKAGVAGAILVTGLAGTLVMQQRSAQALRGENEALRQQVKAMESRTRVETAPRLNQPQGLSDEERTELLRLRGEMGLMRGELAESQKRQNELQETTQRYATELGRERVQEKERETAMIHASNAKQWMLAFHMYAAENNGRYPTNFDQATAFVNASFDDGAFIKATNDFEIFPVWDRNATDPGKTIALRGKARPLASGGWQRAYGMADGSAQTVGAPDGNFSAAEARLGFVYPPKPGR